MEQYEAVIAKSQYDAIRQVVNKQEVDGANCKAIEVVGNPSENLEGTDFDAYTLVVTI